MFLWREDHFDGALPRHPGDTLVFWVVLHLASAAYRLTGSTRRQGSIMLCRFSTARSPEFQQGAFVCPDSSQSLVRRF